MDEYEDLDAYNGDAAHDMNVDFDRYMNTGERAELFDETVHLTFEKGPG